MTEWDTIEQTFTRLRDFVFTDLDRLVTQERGGQFAVVALVMAACDALGRLHYGRDTGDRVFERCLPDHWKPAAPTLYDALRHGLIHGYEPRWVVVGGKPVGFEIAWRGHRHLTFADDNREVLCIVAPVLVTALRGVFDSVEGELRSDPLARDRFRERDRRDREIHLQGPQIETWREAVMAAPIVPRSPSGAIGPDGPVGIGEGATGPKDSGETRR
jgi:hypothetical protein